MLLAPTPYHIAVRTIDPLPLSINIGVWFTELIELSKAPTQATMMSFGPTLAVAAFITAVNCDNATAFDPRKVAKLDNAIAHIEPVVALVHDADNVCAPGAGFCRIISLVSTSLPPVEVPAAVNGMVDRATPFHVADNETNGFAGAVPIKPTIKALAPDPTFIDELDDTLVALLNVTSVPMALTARGTIRHHQKLT